MTRRERIALLGAAVLAAGALLLTGCGAASPGAASPDVAHSHDEGSTAEPPVETAPEAFSSSADCDAYVAAKSASLAESNQQAVQVPVSDLPFTLPDTSLVLCVWAGFTLDAPEERPIGFELVVDGTAGGGLNAFYDSADLTVTPCPSGAPIACFLDGSGDAVVINGSEGLLDFFPVETVLAVNVVTSAEYRNG